MKVLVVEDEIQLLNNIKESLEKEKFIIETANDYHSAIEKVFMYDYDCILLDIMIPNGNGLDILRKIKKAKKSENIIIISAKNSLDDKLTGLDLGADDYLIKPFHLAELNARIKAVIRRKNQDGNSSIEFANIVFDINQRQFSVNNQLISLNRKEFDLLNYFLTNKGRLITKTALAEHVWGDFTDQSDNLDFVYYQIKNLRKKLQKSKADIEITSVYGVGYKLIENEVN